MTANGLYIKRSACLLIVRFARTSRKVLTGYVLSTLLAFRYFNSESAFIAYSLSGFNSNDF
ncbi:hypothetical protein SAMN06265375_10112 [Muriicola jejuensis]|nr:hypothetical protein SAMN06265375_10112 [Muriicola jejuensis]